MFSQVRAAADELDPGVPLFLCNNPREAPYARFANADIDDAFSRVLRETTPRVVHFSHVNHLSSSLPRIAREAGAAVAFTLHDYFLVCPRGTLVQARAPRENLGSRSFDQRRCSREL